MKDDPARWKADYKAAGYLVVEDVLDAVTLASLREGIEAITAEPDALPGHLKQHIQFEREFVRNRPDMDVKSIEEVGNAVRNIMELPAFDVRFARLICYEPLLHVLEVLFGSTEFSFHNYKCIVKAPRISSPFQWHRDLPYLKHSTPNLITAMLCLDDMTRANGATVVLPGTHRIAHEDVRDSDTDIPEANLPSVRRVTVECKAGAAVLFHVNLIHGGGPNRSQVPRRNVIGIWAGPDTYPTTMNRYAGQDLMPRSQDPARQKQLRMTFPNLPGPSAGTHPAGSGPA